MSIVFLTYLNRSGSTYLAKLLSEYSDINIGIEGEFPNGYSRPFPIIRNERELLAFLAELKDDPKTKYQYWKIDPYKFLEQISESSYPLTFRTFLETSLNLYFGSDKGKATIHKAGFFWNFIPQIRKDFGNPKFIFINRDPRAIYSSQRKSLGSINRNPMAKDILWFVNLYVKCQKKIISHRGQSDFHLISYEELLNSNDKIIDETLAFIGLDQSFSKNQSIKYNVPVTQWHLHTNITKEPLKDRIDAWKDELNLDIPD